MYDKVLVSSPNYTAPTGRMISERIRKKTVASHFEVLSRNILGGTADNYYVSQDRWSPD
jgi:hypothetical protein